MRLVAFDCETYLANEGHEAPKLVCASFANSEYCDVATASASIIKLRKLLEDKDVILCGANIAFDFFACIARNPELLPLVFAAYDAGRVLDVLIGVNLHLIAVGCMRDDGLYDPRTNAKFKKADGSKVSRMSLEVATAFLTGRIDAKKHDYWRKRYAILERIPFEQWPDEAIKYCQDDAKNTLDCARALTSGQYLNQHNQSAQAKAAWSMYLASQWGLRTDRAKLEEIHQSESLKLTQALVPFEKLGWVSKTGKTHTKTIQQAVSVAYDFKPPTTEKGTIATDRDTLEESGDERLESFSELSVYKKTLGTYIGALKAGCDKPLVFRENVLLASGRASYSGVIQLLPRSGELRECFVSRLGTVFCSVDYSALELATLAQCMFWLVGSNKMEQAINAGRDLHSVFASSMLGVSYEEFSALLASKDKRAVAYRQAAKPCNFGFPGGMGVDTFVLSQRKVGIRFCEVLHGETCGVVKVLKWGKRAIKPTCKRCLEIAQGLREDWFKAWPEITEYFAFVKNRLEIKGGLEQFVSKRYRGSLRFNSACNTLFQGLAADGAKHALYNLSKTCYLNQASPLYNSRPVIFVHDEIITELLEDKAHDAAFEQARIMIDSMREFVPDVAIKAKPALMRRWYKKAEDVYNAQGRLIPWEQNHGKSS